jgi:uncharacterized protein (DUF58 family)
MLSAFAILLELLGRLVGSTPLAIAAAAALGAVIGDAALTPRIDGITLTRQATTRMTVGVESPVHLVLNQPNRRHSQVPPVLLTDSHPASTPIRLMTPEIKRGSSAVVTVQVTPAHRGYWAADGTDVLEAHSPLGGFVRRRTISFADPIWVHPAPARPMPLPDIAFGAATGTTPSGRSGHGTEFYGIREWRSGDAAANVHWRASARRHQLVVMERERPANAAVVVLVGVATPGEDWEGAVARAAATAIAARRSGQPVTLVCGVQATIADTPRDILDWFAALTEASWSDQATLTNTLRQLGPGATVVWLSTTTVPPFVRYVTRAAAATVVAIGTDPSSRERR